MNQSVYMASNVGDNAPLMKGIGGQNMTPLPPDFIPGEHDVICGRGRKAFNHIGNENFRKFVESRLAEYSNAAAKLEKSYILSDIVCEVRQRSPNGGFVKKDPTTSRWYEVGDFLAREKTSQAFRDALHDQYKSSNTAKKKRRQAEQADKVHDPHNSSGSSLCYDSPTGFESIGKPSMVVSRGQYEPDLLLGALDMDSLRMCNKSGTFTTNAQNSATSVVDFAHSRQQQQQQQNSVDWAHQSCPNFSWGRDGDMFSGLDAMETLNHSAPHMNMMDYMEDTSPRPIANHRSRRLSGSNLMSSVQPPFHSQQYDESESYGDDLMLSPIGDGSPQRLFNSISKLNNVQNCLSPAPMLE